MTQPTNRGTVTAARLLRSGATLAWLVSAIVQCLALQRVHAQAPPFEWVRSAGGTEHDKARAVAVDSTGNVFVAGFIQNQARFGVISLGGPSAGYQAFVAKISPAGDFLWARASSGTPSGSFADARAVTIDSTGNVYLAGFFTGTTTFGGVSVTAPASGQTFLVKYSSAGIALWARGVGFDTLTNPFDDVGSGGAGLGIGGDGSLHLVGGFRDTAPFGGITLTSAGDHDWFHAKYDLTGNLIWVNKAGGVRFDHSSSVVVNSSGESYIVGTFTGPANFGGFSLPGHVQNGTSGFFQQSVSLVKYDSSGAVLWARQETSGYDSAWAENYSVALDPMGNCIVSGGIMAVQYTGTTTFFANPRLFISKYDPSGTRLWVKMYGNNSTDFTFHSANGVTVDGSGNSYIAGFFTHTVSFGLTNLVSAGDRDIFIAKLDSAGNLIRLAICTSPVLSTTVRTLMLQTSRAQA